MATLGVYFPTTRPKTLVPPACNQVNRPARSRFSGCIGTHRRRPVIASSSDKSSPESETTPDTDDILDPPTPAPKSNLKKGNIVRVDKEKYLNSINYLSVGHPKYYKGIDYIYEDRGEILDIRDFVTGEYALISWVGIPTAPAWLPTYMLIKSDKLSYKRT